MTMNSTRLQVLRSKTNVHRHLFRLDKLVENEKLKKKTISTFDFSKSSSKEKQTIATHKEKKILIEIDQFIERENENRHEIRTKLD